MTEVIITDVHTTRSIFGFMRTVIEFEQIDEKLGDHQPTRFATGRLEFYGVEEFRVGETYRITLEKVE